MAEDASPPEKPRRQGLLAFMIVYFATLVFCGAWILTVFLLLDRVDRDASMIGICILLAGVTIAVAVRSRK